MIDDEEQREQLIAEKHKRRAKWRAWQQQWQRYGGGHRKRDGLINPAAIGHFDIDKVKWRDPEYRKQLATAIVALLFKHRRIAIANSRPHWIYRKVGNDWKHASDRQIKACINQHLSLTRSWDIPVQPPDWLPQACRFAAYDLMFTKTEEDDEDD
jgi:hypothetical protein